MASDLTTIPVNFNLPGAFAEFDSSRAQRGLSGLPHKILLLGQKTSAGTATKEVPIAVRQGQAAGLFGRKSHLRFMAEAALQANPYQEIWALPFDDPSSGTAATRAITISGTASDAGTLKISINNKRISAAVASGATAASIAAALKTAIDSDSDLPIASTTKTTSNSNQVLTLTASHKGLMSNNIIVTLLTGITGITVTIANGVSGTGVPSDIVAALGDRWWTEIVNPFQDDTVQNALKAEAEARDGGTIQKPFMIYSARTGTTATLGTYADMRNSRFESVLGVKKSTTPDDIIASVYAAIIARSATNSPARPVQYLSLPSVSAVENFTDAQRNILVGKGISTLRLEEAGGAQIERAVTTYTTNQAGSPDKAFRDVEDMNNLFFLRFSLNARLLRYYANQRIGVDSDPANNGVVRPKDIKAALVGLASEWVREGLVTDIEAFKQSLSVTRDANESDRILIRLTPTLIGQLRQFFTKIEFRL